MSEQKTLDPGSWVTYGTRAGSAMTSLFIRGSKAAPSQITWRLEVCCNKDNVVDLGQEEPRKVDIEAWGALLNVRNTGWTSVQVWTDV